MLLKILISGVTGGIRPLPCFGSHGTVIVPHVPPLPRSPPDDSVLTSYFDSYLALTHPSLAISRVRFIGVRSLYDYSHSRTPLSSPVGACRSNPYLLPLLISPVSGRFRTYRCSIRQAGHFSPPYVDVHTHIVGALFAAVSHAPPPSRPHPRFRFFISRPPSRTSRGLHTRAGSSACCPVGYMASVPVVSAALPTPPTESAC